ncbi:MAG: hypothetical protein AB8B96_16350 [Lysobacterales bacterium]
MHTWAQWLFYIVFAGQIWLVSRYFPRRQEARMRHVLETYPPEEFPRLYPRSRDYYVGSLLAYRWANKAISALGVVVLLALVFVVDHANFADDGYVSEIWPLLFAAVQFIPLIALEISACGQYRMMRRLNTASVRRAPLVPRRLSDFVSPLTLSVAVVLIVAAVGFDAALNGADHGGIAGAFTRSLGLIFGNGVIAISGAMMLRGRKPNPHQSAHDRARHISAALTSSVCVSIALSVFHMAGTLDRAFDLDYLDATISSLYVVIIASLSIGYLMQKLTLRPSDFEGYRDDPTSA